MTDSILLTIRKLVGPGGDHEFFDDDYIVHINTAIGSLWRIGVGPKQGFCITGPDETWTDYLGAQNAQYGGRLLEGVKTYIKLKVQQVFDPSANGTITQAYEKACAEIEFNLQLITDPGADKL